MQLASFYLTSPVLSDLNEKRGGGSRDRVPEKDWANVLIPCVLSKGNMYHKGFLVSTGDGRSSWYCGKWVKMKNAEIAKRGGLMGGGLRAEAVKVGTV